MIGWALGFIGGGILVGGCFLADDMADNTVLFVGSGVATGIFIAASIFVTEWWGS